jgi:hypothetical protein
LKNTATILDGNLRATNPGSLGYYTAFTTMEMTSGKYYFELTVVDDGVNARFSGFGISDSSVALPTIGTSVTTNTTASNSRGWVQLFRSAASATTTGLYNNGASVNTTTRATTSGTRIFMVAYDADTGKCWMGYEGAWWTGDPSAGTSEYFTATAPMTPVLNTFNDGSTSTFVHNINFGQRPFAYTAPSGFKALVTTNLPDPTIVEGDEYFNTVLYTGTGSSLGVTGVGFQPDWVWIKERNGVADHGLYDAVRGVQNQLESNTTTAETTEATGLTAFGTDGFTVGALAQLNTSADTYVAWNWKANGAGSSNTDGTITSTVSVSTTSGFSIVTYTGNATADQTVGHGLGVKPDMFIIKSRTSNPSPSWIVWHRSVCSGNGKAMALEETNALQGPFGTPMWDSSNTTTQSSSTVVTIGANSTINTSSHNYVMYAFAEVEGFSKFGSYLGNGSTDGPFVFTGFRPAFVLVKPSSNTGSWWINDDKRDPYNVNNHRINANTSDAEATASFTQQDFLSNGFKWRNSDSAWNGSGVTYIYMAFSSNPFKLSLAR